MVLLSFASFVTAYSTDRTQNYWNGTYYLTDGIEAGDIAINGGSPANTNSICLFGWQPIGGSTCPSYNNAVAYIGSLSIKIVGTNRASLTTTTNATFNGTVRTSFYDGGAAAADTRFRVYSAGATGMALGYCNGYGGCAAITQTWEFFPGPSLCNNGTSGLARAIGWWNLTFVFNDTKVKGYIDGTNVNRYMCHEWTGVGGLSKLEASEDGGGSTFYLDNLFIANENGLSAGGGGAGAVSTPSFSAPTPSDNAHNNTNITINCTHTGTDINYTFWVDGAVIYNGTPNSANGLYFNWTSNWADGTYLYTCAVLNATSNIYSSNISRTYTLDTSKPTISTTLYYGSPFRIRGFPDYRDNLTASLTYADNNLWGYETFIDGVIVDNRSNLGVTTYIYNFTYNISNLSAGHHLINYTAFDGHTASSIAEQDITKNILTKSITFKYSKEDNSYLKIIPKNSLDYISSFDTTYAQDRYILVYDRNPLEKLITKDITFRVTSTDRIEIAKDQSKYAGWMVIPNQKRWIDFNTKAKYDKMILTRLDDYNVEVKLTNVIDDKIVFESTGMVNVQYTTYDLYIINATVGYYTSINEGSSQTTNVTVNTVGISLDINATFRYNNISYAVSKVSLPTQILFNSQQFNASSIPGVETNISSELNWTLFIESYNFSTILINQTVINVNIDNCSNYTNLLLNYTLYDEDNLTLISGDNEYIKVNVNLVSNTLKYNYSNKFYGNNALVCTLSNISEGTVINVITEYDADSYVHEFNYIQNLIKTTSNIPQHIKLYDLLNSPRSTIFIITIKDNVFLPISNAIIEILRNYIDKGEYFTVESGLTDTNGQTIGHFVVEDVNYGFIIKKDNIVLDSFYGIIPTCQDTPCQINLNQFNNIQGTSDFGSYDNLAYSIDLNETTKTVTTIFSILDSTFSDMNLTVFLYNNWGTTNICHDTLTSSSGILTCIIPAIYTNSTVKVNLYKDGQYVTTRQYDLEDLRGYAIFGYTGYFMAAMLYLTLALMSIANPVGAIILAIIGFIAGGSLFLISTKSLFTIGSITIWFVIAGAILIWKITSREN